MYGCAEAPSRNRFATLILLLKYQGNLNWHSSVSTLGALNDEELTR